ncbi:heterokaryon incompatibility protein-domain-containing protein [Coniochaeta sp. 2T2.1]|nr:heterokaryon incompatibility protein-domain-containing protein [Coniochaeta sp. 2T2.1]
MLDQDAYEPVSPSSDGEHGIPINRTCTAICAKLSNLTLVNGKLPTHEQLTSHLAVDDNHDLQDGFPLGTIHDIRQRQHCPICQLVLSAISDNDLQPPNHATDADLDQQPINLLLFPGETSLRLSHPSRLGTRLSFLSSSASDISGPDSARLVTNNAQLNPSQILSWLRKCEQHHGAKCHPHHLADQDQDKQQSSRRYDAENRFNVAATSNFRVIDLEAECIVPQALDARYVALSYVWGQGAMVRLTRSNYDALRKEGGLRGVMGQLPRTITDAMVFVKGLGVRYLWVDALCLVQDDEEDVELGMEVMNSVYQGSWFTVIAAEGADAEAGLPGVGPGLGRGVRQVVVELGQRGGGGLKMTVQHSIDWHLRRSVYKSRGWTLQELVLPRRTVVFVNQMVYFRCQEANWAEETTADVIGSAYLDPDDGNISRIPDPVAEGGVRSWWAYQKLTEEYSTRQIRFDGDALRASAGVLRPLCAGMETRMLEGLPANYLDNALLFVSSRGDMRRRKGFASYSWAGWEGSVMWPRENYVRYDEQGKRTWEVDNLFRWFAGRTFINWSYLSVNAHQRSLMRDYGDPSRLGSVLEGIVEEYPHLRERLLDSFDPRATAFDSKYSRGGGSGPFYPNWSLDRGKRAWNHAAFDLANGQAEYARLVRNVYRAGNKMEYLTIQNWIASRGAHTVQQREGVAERGKDGQVISKKRQSLADSHGSSKIPSSAKDREPPRPKSIGRFSEQLHYRFRHVDEVKKPREDKREQTARMSSAYQKDPDMAIAKFPPYSVLYFQTISLSLTLGQPPDELKKQPQPGGTTSSFHRIPGIPLLSATSEVIGSLHPDNLDLLPGMGSSVECILMSHCQALTWNSALGHGARPVPDPEDHEAALGDDEPLELFWALYIVWEEGIAERRGVAQLLATAVGQSLGPGPEIKEIHLG